MFEEKGKMKTRGEKSDDLARFWVKNSPHGVVIGGRVVKSSSGNHLGARDLRQPRVLLMDDEEMVGDVTANLLEHFGYQVETAADGNEAIKLYRRTMKLGLAFDAVILDLTVPGGMGGKETLAELVKIDPSINAIVSSGYSNDPVISSFQSYGFKGRIVKPFRVDELIEVLDTVLER